MGKTMAPPAPAGRSVRTAGSRRPVAPGKPAALVPAKRKTKAATPPSGWRRAASDQSLTQQLGVRLRAVRESKGLSLAQLSEKSGIPSATLSRIETSKMSPTFGVLARVMMGLEVDWVDVVGPKRLAPGERLASFADAGMGDSTTLRKSSATVLHSHESAHSLPLLAQIEARTLAETGGLLGHRGEEFCYVLSGTLALHMEGRAPRIMKAGASALFDSSTPHAYISGGSKPAKILLVVVRAYGQHLLPDANPTRP